MYILHIKGEVLLFSLVVYTNRKALENSKVIQKVFKLIVLGGVSATYLTRFSRLGPC